MSWAERRCIYCGERTHGRLACAEHRDLLLLDPHYRIPPTMGETLREAVQATKGTEA